MENIVFNPRRTEQVIGREGETATLFSRCVVTFGLRVAGFAPRQLNRSAFLVGKANAPKLKHLGE